MKTTSIVPEYVELLPPTLLDGKLYISKKYSTAVHKCCCGCGTKIVTPLKPTDWTLSERGGLVSLTPSIGNWNHPCQSHYFIRNNRIVVVGKMSKGEIARGRALNEVAKQAYFSKKEKPSMAPSNQTASSASSNKSGAWLEKFKRWLAS